MKNILNIIQEDIEFGNMEFNESDKKVFLELAELFKTNGIEIKYMRTPVDMIGGEMFTVNSFKMSKNYEDNFIENFKTAKEIFDYILEYNLDKNKDDIIFNNTIYLYKIFKIKYNLNISQDFSYCLRIGIKNIK